MSIFDKRFVLATAERAIKTFAQALLALFVGGVTILTIDWQQALAVAGTAAVLSILMSVVSKNLGKWEGPSLTDEALVEEGLDIEVELDE